MKFRSGHNGGGGGGEALRYFQTATLPDKEGTSRRKKRGRACYKLGTNYSRIKKTLNCYLMLQLNYEALS